MKGELIMTYEETINYLYTRLPLYQKEGTKADKPGLQNIEALDMLCNSPHKKFKTIANRHFIFTNSEKVLQFKRIAMIQMINSLIQFRTGKQHMQFFSFLQ